MIATILIVTGTSNGANLTDGLDGLTAGISAIIGLIVIGAIHEGKYIYR